MDIKILGRRLKAWREETTLTQVQIAQLAGLSQGKISQLESGIRKSFSFDTLDKVLAVFKKDYADLFCPIEKRREVAQYLNGTRRMNDPPDYNPKTHRKIPACLIRVTKSVK